MLEGVLKEDCRKMCAGLAEGFNPWYVGGGVKSLAKATQSRDNAGFNPWYVGGGVKRKTELIAEITAKLFQSLVCWRGC